MALYVVLILGALFLSLGYMVGKPKRSNEVTVLHEQLFKINHLAWETTLYSDGHIVVEPKPYCSVHEMELYENWPVLFCPMHHDCNCQLSTYDLESTFSRDSSIIKAHIRKQNKHLTSRQS